MSQLTRCASRQAVSVTLPARRAQAGRAVTAAPTDRAHAATVTVWSTQGSTADDPSCSGRPHTARALSAVAAAVVLCLSPGGSGVAQAYNVRLQDVESPELKAGLQAATSGDLLTAERIFSAMLKDHEADTSSASTWSNLGNVHMSLGRAPAAVADYSRAIALAPEAPVPYLNRAIAEEELGVRLSEDGDAQAAQQQWDQALADCERATQLDPKEFAAHFNMGNVQMRLGDWEGAEASFGRAADLAPGLAGYRLRQAQLAFQTGHTQQAIKLMQGVARKYPSYAEAHAALAAVLWADGRRAEAENAFQAAKETELKWDDMRFVKASTRWPPALYEAMQSLLSIS